MTVFRYSYELYPKQWVFPVVGMSPPPATGSCEFYSATSSRGLFPVTGAFVVLPYASAGNGERARGDDFGVFVEFAFFGSASG